MKRMLKYTTEDFIRMSKERFGNDTFLYEHTVYNGSNTDVTITCRKHGDFTINTHSHLHSGVGCPYCSGARLHYSDFVAQANKIHNNKYQYSEDIIQESFRGNIPIPIICPKHGVFIQKPTAHLTGRGCSKCAGNENISFEEFVERAKKIHQDKDYEYDEKSYTSYNEKITIKCPIHGFFSQRPRDHVRGHGCPVCGKTRPTDSTRFTLKEFVEKANEVHNGSYGYDNVVYVNARTDVAIKCPIHGLFMQTPFNHINRKCGCPICAQEGRFLTFEEFVEQSRAKHGDNIDYECAHREYKDTKTKVSLKCNKCGRVFRQEPRTTMSGKGCPWCRESRIENAVVQILEKEGIVYEREKKFDWLINVTNMKLDFYLPDYGVGIECQGTQHFRPEKWYGGDEGFVLTNGRDKKKYQLCKENGVRLLYFGDKRAEDSFLNERVYKTTDELLTAIKQ